MREIKKKKKRKKKQKKGRGAVPGSMRPQAGDAWFVRTDNSLSKTIQRSTFWVPGTTASGHPQLFTNQRFPDQKPARFEYTFLVPNQPDLVRQSREARPGRNAG